MGKNLIGEGSPGETAGMSPAEDVASPNSEAEQS
jgi:hypothetical protein